MSLAKGAVMAWHQFAPCPLPCTLFKLWPNNDEEAIQLILRIAPLPKNLSTIFCSTRHPPPLADSVFIIYSERISLRNAAVPPSDPAARPSCFLELVVALKFRRFLPEDGTQ